MRRAVPLLILAGLALSGALPVPDPAVCTGCCEGEEGACVDPVCAACIGVGGARILAPLPEPEPADADRGAVVLGPPGRPLDPPASEILHVPKPLLG